MDENGKTDEFLLSKQAYLEHLKRSKEYNVSKFANFASMPDEVIGELILEAAHKTFIGRTELSFADKNRLALFSNEFQNAMKKIMADKTSNQVSRKDALVAVKFAAFVGTLVGDNAILKNLFDRAKIAAESKINKERGSRGGKVRAANHAAISEQQKNELLKVAQVLLKAKPYSTQGKLADAILDSGLSSELLRTRETLVQYIREWKSEEKIAFRKNPKKSDACRKKI